MPMENYQPGVVVGCDPSTKTGLVILDGTTVISQVLTSQKKGIARVEDLHLQFARKLKELRPQAVCIEGYAFANKFTLALLVEINSAMRLACYRFEIPCYIAPPSVVKKFATDKGNAKKDAIAVAVKNRWGFEAPSDDVVDAYVMAQIAKKCVENGPFEGIELL